MLVTLDFGTREQDQDGVIRLSCPITFCYRNKPLAVPLWAQRTLEHLIDRHRPDIVHVHHPFFLGVAGLRAARARGIPVVFTHHTWYEKYVHHIPVPAQLGEWYAKKRVIDFCNSVDLVIAPSRAVIHERVASGVRARMQVLPSAIHEQFFLENPPDKIITDHQRVSLLFVGRFEREKNVHALLDVFAQCDYARFELVMVGFGSLEQELKQYAQSVLGIPEESITWIIRPPFSELVERYRQAHIFLFCSQTETQGMVLAEALAAGTPVIALSGPGVDDAIVSGENGFLCHSRAEFLAALHRVITAPELYARLVLGAWESSKKYRRSVIAKRLLELYESLM